VRLDSTQARLIVRHVLLDLGSAQLQHAAQVLDGEILAVQQLSDLLEREPEVPERKETVQTADLPDRVEAVAALWIHAIRSEQAELVIVAEHARRNLT
jgi:hypothetical protein